ncbi:MAG TPA: CocE/NonD family hydrolase [Micromonosporaceae bacterium]|nr:CocE/NonD family hydrolase [Micromonosporaceae bacterium]
MSMEKDLPVKLSDGAVVLVDHLLPDGPGPAARVVVWIRSPYGRVSLRGLAKRFTQAGAHVLIEAMRGTDGSGGRVDGFHYDPADAADMAAWLRGQSWFPGVIVTWGISAIGYAGVVPAVAGVPEWRLAVLQDSCLSLRSVVYPGEAFAAKTMLGGLASLDLAIRRPGAGFVRGLVVSLRAVRKANKILTRLPLGTADARLVGHPVDCWRQWLANEQPGPYWQERDLGPHVDAMPPLVHLATGWYDLNLASTLDAYATLRAAGKRVRLVIGPWYHGRGAMDPDYRTDVDAWITAAADPTAPGPASLTPVRVHVGGVDEWRELPDWPPPGITTAEWHLHPDGRLATEPAPDGAPAQRYRYDPTKPTPAIGGAMENFDGKAGPKDNRRLEQRPDVLTYTSDPLAADVETIGPTSATITVQASSEHLDVFVRLCDVHPDGRSINICDGIQRLRAPGTWPRTVTVDLAGLAHKFSVGHRIRVQVSSGAHPRFARNTGTGQPLATASVLHPVDVQIGHPSRILLPVTR